jgi:hypothetical protein
MPRGSDKHSPRIDESLEHDTRPLTQGAPSEARSDESRHQEGAADDEPVTDALLTGDIHPGEEVSEDVLGHDEVEARSRLAAHLRPSVWPADREALVACAQEMHAPPSVIDRLRQLPEGTFTHTEAVWEALGGRVEYRP